MWAVCKKEWNQFFNSIIGYLAVAAFLLLLGLLLFVFPDTNLLDFGYANLNGFFELTPWVLLFFIPVITMRTIAEELKTGSFELLKTLPLSGSQLVGGKYLGALLVVFTALLPTLVYVISIQQLSGTAGIDVGATAGSYLGLFLLAALFTAVGVFTSSLTANTVVAFVAGSFTCFLLYTGFDAAGSLLGSAGYYVEMLGIRFHYKSISRGVVDTGDVIYFVVMIGLFLRLTMRRIGG
jgi:ABC-2 type transport system permease protein